MLNPIIVQNFCILLDPKRRLIEVINYSKGYGSLTITSLTVEISGLPGGSGIQLKRSLNIAVTPETYLPLHLPVLDEAIGQFHDKNPDLTYFRTRITVDRQQANLATTQHATFLGKFEGHTCEIDRYPIESDLG